MLTKSKFVQHVADKKGVSKKEALEMVDFMFGEILELMRGGESINITGFGIFRVYDRKERMGRNPQTGEAIKIAAKKMPKFRPGKLLKEAVS